ncbi:hypothetical protein TgHK011_003614 [Trichoderma gracile]|nr:hypothetical protein TgHK011_003614 [Trichoderma gracile]
MFAFCRHRASTRTLSPASVMRIEGRRKLNRDRAVIVTLMAPYVGFNSLISSNEYRSLKSRRINNAKPCLSHRNYGSQSLYEAVHFIKDNNPIHQSPFPAFAP